MSLDKKINEFEIIDNVCEDSLSVSNVKQFIKELLEAEPETWFDAKKLIRERAGKGLI